jgi:hypothetical protein
MDLVRVENDKDGEMGDGIGEGEVGDAEANLLKLAMRDATFLLGLVLMDGVGEEEGEE